MLSEMKFGSEYEAAPATEVSAATVATASEGQRVSPRSGAVAAGLAMLLGVGATAWFSSAGGVTHLRQLPHDAEAELEVKAAPFISGKCGTAEASSMCGEWEADMEYQVDGGWFAAMDHVPSAEMCCAMCQGVPQCQVFTWVKDAGLGGCPSQCWLKGGQPSAKNSKPGFVSGVAPQRAALPAVLAPAPAPGGTQLFCWSLIVPGSYEEALLALQEEKSTSIFSCDGWSVYSNISKRVGTGITTTAVETNLEVKFGGDSYTALNSWIFIALWKKVIDEQRHKQFQWIVKVDPDAVFFTERLRPIVAAHPDAGYINNCKFGLHGPIEVIAASTLSILEADYKQSFDGKAPKQCVEKLEFGEWGEDFFLSRCMWEIHGITRELDANLMCEAHCECNDWYWCDRPDVVTFHPFKRADMYEQCMANSLAAAGPFPAKK